MALFCFCELLYFHNFFPIFPDTKAIWTNAGQGQVFAGESGLSEEEREALYLDLSVPCFNRFLPLILIPQKFDPNYVNEVYELATSFPFSLLTPLISSIEPKDASDDATEPVETAMSTNASSVFSYLTVNLHFS